MNFYIKCNCHKDQDSEKHYQNPKPPLHTFQVFIASPGKHYSDFHHSILVLPGFAFHINTECTHYIHGIWLLLFNIKSGKFIILLHVAIVCFLISVKYSTVYLNLFTHSTVAGYLGCSQFF